MNKKLYAAITGISAAAIIAIVTQTDKVPEHITTVSPVASDTYTVIGKLPGLKNFVVKYNGVGLYRGGEPTSPEAVESLKSLGVETVISINPCDAERAMLKGEFNLIEIPFSSDVGPSKTDIATVLQELDAVTVYLHCSGGTRRAGVIGACYRVFADGWSIEAATKEYAALGGHPDYDADMLP